MSRARGKLHLMAEKAFGLNAIPAGDAPAAAPSNGGRENTPVPAPRPVSPPAPARVVKHLASDPALPAPVRVAAPSAQVPQGAMFAEPPTSGGVPFTAPRLSTEQKRVALEQLDANEVKGCTRCGLCETRTNTVFGEGDVDARLMFIGEGPGENEDLSGRPFVGRAGELLTTQIVAMGLTRERVFIANVVKCRPPNNRTPLPDEVSACTPYLERQIEMIRPEVIVTLGLPATQYLLNQKQAMGKMRGKWHAWKGIAVMPTYHPAYLLRNYTAEVRRMVWDDLQQVMDRLGLPRKKRATGGE